MWWEIQLQCQKQSEGQPQTSVTCLPPKGEHRDSVKQEDQIETKDKEPKSHYPHSHLLLYRIKVLYTTSLHMGIQRSHGHSAKHPSSAAEEAKCSYLTWTYSIHHSRDIEILSPCYIQGHKGCEGMQREEPRRACFQRTYVWKREW